MAAKLKLATDTGGGNDTSLAHNNAAKDDCLTFNWDNSYNVSALLANDPGSAHNVTFGAGVTDYNPATGTFGLAAGVTSFDYTEQEANGTLSTAHVNLAGKASGELVLNSSFEQQEPGATVYGGSIVNGQIAGGFTSGEGLPDWANLRPSVALEDVSVQYGGFGTNIAGDDHWLDTQGSPGGIDISQGLKLNAGSARMTFMVAEEPPITTAGGQVFQEDPNERLTFLLDGKAIGNYAAGSSMSQADFTNVGAGVFKQFTFNTDVASTGQHTLEIASNGATNAYVGFAIDSVSVQQIIPLPC